MSGGRTKEREEGYGTVRFGDVCVLFPSILGAVHPKYVGAISRGQGLSYRDQILELEY